MLSLSPACIPSRASFAQATKAIFLNSDGAAVRLKALRGSPKPTAVTPPMGCDTGQPTNSAVSSVPLH